MKTKISLTEQLLYLTIIIVSIIVISLGIILPKTLLPIYEENLYNYLKQPLTYIENINDITNKINTEIAFIYTNKNSNTINISENLETILDLENLDTVINKITDKYGKIRIKNKTYYYYNISSTSEKRIALTDDKYITDMKKNIFSIILLIVGVTFGLVSLIIITWSNKLVNRIKKIKDKVDNINNDDYKFETNDNYDDELSTLDSAVKNMKLYLKENELYKNQMYQNISHDFKTPITVMKSYIEASEDGIETKDKSLNIIKEQLNKLEIIKEQINKLEKKVHSLLYLNKLNYIKDKTENKKSKTNISSIITSSTDKFKLIRPDIKFTVDLDKNTTFKGTEEMWETIIDNILNNFMRYAKKEIKITIKNKKIILFNDGDKIDENILNSMFTPYEKGLNGMFGLGLSIVKKSLQLLDYDITVNNVKNGVNFIIK